MKDEEFEKIQEIYKTEISKRKAKEVIEEALDKEISDLDNLLNKDTGLMKLEGKGFIFDTETISVTTDGPSEFEIQINYPLIFKKYLQLYFDELKEIQKEVSEKEY